MNLMKKMNLMKVMKVMNLMKVMKVMKASYSILCLDTCVLILVS